MLKSRALCFMAVENYRVFNVFRATGIFTSALHLYSPSIYMTNPERVAIFASTIKTQKPCVPNRYP